MGPDAGAAISVRGLTRVFVKPRPIRKILRASARETVTALLDVSFDVAPREIVSLLGPAGAGKTTLLKVLATLVAPTSGAASVAGHDVRVEPAKVKDAMGYVVSDERSFYHRLTGRQNLAFFAALMEMPSEAVRRRVDEILELVGLADARDTMVKDYSSGMRQKLAIARGILADPEVLLMDEPSRSLDPLFKEKLRDLVKEQLRGREGRTILFATHDLTEAQAISDRIAILHRGRLLALGSLDTLAARWRPFRRSSFEIALGPTGAAQPFPEGATAEALGSGPAGRSFRVTLDDGDDPSALVSHLISRREQVLAVVPLRPTLRDILKAVLEGEDVPDDASTGEPP